MKLKCDCHLIPCPEPEYELEVWVQFDPNTWLATGRVCSAYYPDDKPLDQTGYVWLKMKESQDK